MTDTFVKRLYFTQKYRTLNDQLVATSGDMLVSTGNHFRISVISLKKYYLV